MTALDKETKPMNAEKLREKLGLFRWPLRMPVEMSLLMRLFGSLGFKHHFSFLDP